MSKVEVTSEVSKELYELVDALGQMALAVKAALADGWQVGTDLPVLVAAAMSTLGPAVEGVDKITDEVAEDLGASVLALAVPLAKLLPELLKKTDTPVG